MFEAVIKRRCIYVALAACVALLTLIPLPGASGHRRLKKDPADMSWCPKLDLRVLGIDHSKSKVAIVFRTKKKWSLSAVPADVIVSPLGDLMIIGGLGVIRISWRVYLADYSLGVRDAYVVRHKKGIAVKIFQDVNDFVGITAKTKKPDSKTVQVTLKKKYFKNIVKPLEWRVVSRCGTDEDRAPDAGYYVHKIK